MHPAASLVGVVPENSIRFLGHDTHEHDVPHLVHIVIGTAELVVDGVPMRMRARENLWLAPHVPHSVRLSDDGVALGPFLSPETVPPERVRRLGIVPALTDLMTTILVAGPVTPEQVRPFREALDDVLRGIDDRYFPLVLPAHAVARAIAREALSPLTLGELAAARHTSVRHVQRLFQEETGLPFTRWRTRARLNVAIGRLKGGSSLAAAARASGYATRGGLVKAIGRETGLSAERLSDDPLAALAEARPAA
ncbi:AraC family transcriptional regulator [Glycomyces sp. NRRL B-16210]|uniref:helix-turn-helix domain-containing protein n=1 Tax=Glycomyces sp. NRRL B-16210 TaxID=1463821 RepID=UPI0004C085B3|nr:AraC family transcriptional regulator [Glycomyces sp. NRRL B-16210]